MCKFLSAIGMKNGDILCDPSIDSHEDIIRQHSLNDNGSLLRNWVRIEFFPDKAEDYINPGKYKLNIDDIYSDWITDTLKSKWVKKLKTKLSRLIIIKDTPILPSGTYIIGDGVVIERVLYCRVFRAGNSTIENAEYSTIENAEYSTIKNAEYSTIINK